ncbi:hypothetical protein CLV98_11862 [Dyadobacter jejuensis]|uniref:Uncharacterized protein n=1 Tax=Dyadobacter jejuensis TaxID=1082580 RepID=A0A316ABA3_9BACT|nr:hypothetical protein CLV98_11862 [Dyadobacter jejuensis]
MVDHCQELAIINPPYMHPLGLYAEGVLIFPPLKPRKEIQNHKN